jgi:integrase-like protein
MDNVFIERLWPSMKCDDINLKGYADGRETRTGIGIWMASYNDFRPHQPPGNESRWRSGPTASSASSAPQAAADRRDALLQEVDSRQRDFIRQIAESRARIV